MVFRGNSNEDIIGISLHLLHYLGYLWSPFIGMEMNWYCSELKVFVWLCICLDYFQVTPPTPSSVYSQSSAPTVTAILTVIFIGGIIAGVAYYFLKHKNDAFRFQYFKVNVFP